MIKKIVTGLVCASSICFTTVSSASVIGVFGDYSSSVSSLTNSLVNMGHSVTNLGTDATQDLSSFDSVWGVSAFNALDASEQSNLAGFLSSGGGVYLTGERPCCEVLNSSLTTFVNTVVLGGGIQVGGIGDQNSSATINQSVVGNLASAPNTITSWSPNASGGMTGLAADNIFATSTSTGNAVAAAWDMSDMVDASGRMVLMMDVNWLGTQLNVLENIEIFLAGAEQANNSNDIPEPAGILLLSLGLVGLALKRRKA
ncbi:PEP-CTERM sorting domain-containing protein [Aliiglaciecola lipolytica]|uniref:Ice-binding protein C-terminal domain-containing protein n=1 Tax=Aliiglaciecola lipolytica E3 TaxID=1127673 RepID=K6X875_9ALTE|nr:PEP-CTERM sorting domain-containing protein [Aliiglaciecola lipolytica]GAC16799.1 hypothetical protein GLIP_4188 [Aliiglaciecola lipolytica E3]